MSHRSLSLTCLLLALPCAATAADYTCTQGDLVRRIEIVYEPGRALPCEVHYYKDTEAPGESEVLWTAQNDAGYCEARTEELVERLRGYGWNCSASSPDEDAEDGVDDTDALTPSQ